jgi:hypothetical protein
VDFVWSLWAMARRAYNGQASLPFALVNYMPSPPSTQNPRDMSEVRVVRRGDMKEKPFCPAEFTH